MGVQISEELLTNAKMTPEEFLVEVSVHLYDIGKLTLGQARKMANIDQLTFQKAMADRDVYMKYDVEDFMLDLKNISILEEE